MSAPKVIAYADGHVDARGVGGFDAAQGLTSNSVEALRSLAKTIDLCNEQDADVLVAAGDLFDTGKPSPEIVARVEEQFERLERTKVVLLDGNHDQQGILSGHRTAIESYFASKRWCAGAFSHPGVVEVGGVAIASLPWLRVSNSNALGSTNDALKKHVDDLAEQIERLGGASMLIGHLTLAECSFDSGKRGSESSMVTSTLEASIPVAELDAGPWSVARLGHIHKRQQVSDKTGYIGSPYKVSFGETKDSKGVDIVTFGKKGTDVEFHKFDVRELVKIDLTDVDAPSLTYSAREGDIVRLIANSETLERAESMSRAFVAAGASSQIHRVPDDMVVIQREAKYSTEMAPADALVAYLDKKGIEAEQRAAISAAFADVAAACQH